MFLLSTCNLNINCFGLTFDINAEYIMAERNACSKIHIILFSNGNGLVNLQTHRFAT